MQFSWPLQGCPHSLVSLTFGGSLATTGLHVAITDLDCRAGQAGGRESITVRGLECAPTVRHSPHL